MKIGYLRFEKSPVDPAGIRVISYNMYDGRAPIIREIYEKKVTNNIQAAIYDLVAIIDGHNNFDDIKILDEALDVIVPIQADVIAATQYIKEQKL